MEPGSYLAVLVFSVAALHVITRVATSIHLAFKGSHLNIERKPVKRGDWYMFFHCSSITGVQMGIPQKRARLEIAAENGRRSVKDSRSYVRRHFV